MDVSNYQLSINNYQLPKGYKQTEIGMIPEDWKVTTIGDIASVSSGGTPSRTNLSYWDGSIPWVTTTQIDFNIIADAEQFITQNGLKNSAAKLFPPGTLLMAMYGQGKTRGKVAILGIEATTNQACAAISLSERIEHSYIFHYLISQYESIRDLSNTGNQENLNGLIIKSIEVALPPKEEQRAIATTLSDVDALIAALDKLIAKQRHLKTATMQQLLTGKKRLPGFGGEWTEKQIGPEIDLLTGFPFPSAQYFDSGIKLLRGSNIKRGVTDWSDDLVQYWPEVTSDISQYVLNEGDVVVAMDGSLVGRSFARLSKDDLPALLLQRVARIRSDKIDMGYLKEWVCSKFFIEHCDAVKTVTAIPHISPDDIRSFVIQVPPTQEEQRAIATVLSDMDAAIAALEARRAKTQAIKQGMMQELLTGKTRLV